MISNTDVIIAVSIPVHENTDVVINQIQNFKRFIPHSILVLHISKLFTDSDELKRRVADYPSVYVNPNSVDCAWDNLIWAHISNYKYISQTAKFDYFMMHASNDMYIRPGVEEYVLRYSAGFHIHKVLRHSRWWPGNQALKDKKLNTIMGKINAENIIATQVESSFYKKELFDQILGIIESVPGISEDAEKLRYTREEIYFSTIAYAITDHSKIGYPTTFSEVHRFDRRLWRIQRVSWWVYQKLGFYKFIPKEKYDAFERYYSGGIGKHRFWRLKVGDVKKLLHQNRFFIRRNMFLDDEVSRYQLYGDNFYSVKRVDRDMKNPVRKFINDL